MNKNANNIEFVFPNEIFISYAVCRKECGNEEFIIDGSSQICKKCGHMMFRTAVKKYIKTEENHKNAENKTAKTAFPHNVDFYQTCVGVKKDYEISLNNYPEVVDETVVFPDYVDVVIAECTDKCGNKEFIIVGSSSQICQYCGSIMKPLQLAEYKLYNDVK